MSEPFKKRGTIVEIYDEHQVSPTFKTRDFVIETQDQYPKPVKFTAKQAVCDFLDSFKIGDEVEVCFDLDGRPYQSKKVIGQTEYFTTVVAWKIQKVGASKPTTQAATRQIAPEIAKEIEAPASGGQDDLPF